MNGPPAVRGGRVAGGLVAGGCSSLVAGGACGRPPSSRCEAGAVSCSGGVLPGGACTPSTGATLQVRGVYRAHYRGSGPPLHQAPSTGSLEGVSVVGFVEGEPSTRRAASSSSAGTAASRSALR